MLLSCLGEGTEGHGFARTMWAVEHDHSMSPGLQRHGLHFQRYVVQIQVPESAIADPRLNDPRRYYR